MLSSSSSSSRVRALHERATWLTVFLLLGPLSIFGELLARHTHLRPLGAVTFAFVAVVLFQVTHWTLRRAVVLRGGNHPEIRARTNLPAGRVARTRASATWFERSLWVVALGSSLVVFARALI